MKGVSVAETITVMVRATVTEATALEVESKTYIAAGIGVPAGAKVIHLTPPTPKIYIGNSEDNTPTATELGWIEG